MTQQTFRPGQPVVWGNRDATMKAVTECFGQGPFKICTVEDIPANACSCGGSLDDETHLAYSGCPYSNMGYRLVRESVGHPQSVTIDDGTGKPLTTMISGKKRVVTFSGLYFKAA